MLTPNWPALPQIKAFMTTRQDEDLLRLNLPSPLILLKQVHGTKMIPAEDYQDASTIIVPEADVIFTTQPNKICAVRTADCLPILVADIKSGCVAAIHAGWKGIAAGVIEKTLQSLPVRFENILIWLGPGIGAGKFEVGEDMRAYFADLQDSKAFKEIKSGGPQKKYLCDILLLAKNRLNRLNIQPSQISHTSYCTYSDADLFYSYRREGIDTGRMTSLIWKTV